MRKLSCSVFLILAVSALLSACRSPQKAAPSAAPKNDEAFTAVAHEYLEDLYRRQPTQATYLGIHKYDDQLENYSRAAVTEAVAAARAYRDRVSAIDAASLTLDNQLDQVQLLHALDSRLLSLEVVRPWARDADAYSSGLTNTAYIMIKREFASPEERMRKLIAREKTMPAALVEARKNLESPPRIYTQIAIDQLDGNRELFQKAVPEAFTKVSGKALLAEFKTATDAGIAALGEYKIWLQDDLLKRSTGEFAFGDETYRKKLAADEMIDVPLDTLLATAERDLKKNQAAFAEAARLIDPKRTPEKVLAEIELN